MNKRTLKEALLVYGPGVTLAILGFLVAWRFVDPAPPYKIVLGAGPEASDYAKVGRALSVQLSQDQLEVEVMETSGSSDNLELLRQGKIDVAIVQGGIRPEWEEPALFALGSLQLEPLWLLRRKGQNQAERLIDFHDLKLAVGAPGSGTRVMALSLLKECEVDSRNELLEVPVEEGLEKLKQGEVDGAFLVAPPHSQLLLGALRDEAIECMSFRRAAAYERLHPILQQVVIPEGSLDMAANLPQEEKRLIAPAATLVVRADFHPALVGVVLSGARKVIGQPGVLADRGQFPSPEYCSFPLREEASIFYERGASFLYRHLPFRLAATVDRLVIMLLPFLTLLIPLAKILPAILDWRLRSKITRQYKALLTFEARYQELEPQEREQRLNELEREVAALLTMPASYGADVHQLKAHLESVREKVKRNEPGK